MKERSRWYVGCNHLDRMPFASKDAPDDLRSNYNSNNSAVIGPFRTKKAAHIYAEYGREHHLYTVMDAERVVKQYQDDIESGLHSALRRGHAKLDANIGQIAARFACQSCGKAFFVLMFPMPNEIRVGGNAVAMDCLP